MKDFLRVMLPLGLALSVTAQRPHPCKSPPLLEARMSVYVTGQKLAIFEKVFYDAIGEKMRLLLTMMEGNQTVKSDILILVKEEIYYEIHHHNRSCVTWPYTTPFQPIHIPSDAQHQSQVIVGSLSGPGEGLLVNNWVGSLPEYKDYFLTFTEFGCLPISMVYQTPKLGTVFTSFYDIVVGIEDPEVFFPPDFCDSRVRRQAGDGPVERFLSTLL